MKNAILDGRTILPLFALTVMLGVPGAVKGQPPDLTTVNLASLDTTYNYSLGPTGMRGWMSSDSHGNETGMDDSMTEGSWQILVVAVGANTPASGIMASNDVILGLSTGAGTPVSAWTYSATNDARKSLGWAIGAAEAGDRKLNLLRWRAGVATTVTLQLQVLGAYSATAPYNCPKSALILSNACNIIWNAASTGLGSHPNNDPQDPVMALALMASGNPSYLAKVQTYARSIGPANLSLTYTPPAGGAQPYGNGATISPWSWGYRGIFLAEYYLLTGDTNVLPAINQFTLGLAQGQSRYGTMAHGCSLLDANGNLHGTMPPYGPVNQGGLTANMAIVMGNKCLVASGMPIDPEIPAAIGRAANFFGYYVQKGSIPYGEHEPCVGDTLGGGHSSNGKDCSAAVMFAMMGDQPTATEYFTRMTVAGYNGREYGHTGQGFSYLWGAMGANVGGTNAAAAYLAQIRWHLDLERRSDGSFVYDGGEQYGGTASYDYWNTASYYNMDPTATYVLAYALPLQKLLITGRNANPTNWLSSDEVTNAIWAGVFHQACTSYNTNQLMSALGEYDPQVRDFAAVQLGSLANAAPLFPVLTNLAAGSTNPWLREAACHTLGVMANANALPVLVNALYDSDAWVRGRAANALRALGSAASGQVNNMIMAFTNNATDPNVIVWSDPVQIANGFLSFELFGDAVYGGNNVASYTKSAPTYLLYPAVQAGLAQPDSNPRFGAAQFAQNNLTLANVKVLLPQIVTCAAIECQADTMWSMNPRACAIATLAKYHVTEAMPLALSMLTVPTGFGWGSDGFQNGGLNALATYGDSARWTLPTLKGYLSAWDPTSSQFATLNSTIASISAAVTSPTLTNLYAVANSQVVVTTNAKAVTLTGFSWRTNSVGFTNVTAPAHGTLSGTAPNLTYTPAGSYVGLDSFTFQVFDSVTSSPPATVSLIVGMPAGTGLSGSYYTNVNFTGLKFTRTDPQVNFDWGASAPTNTMASTNYSVRWTGLLLAPESANYMFSTLNSDGVRLYVNGVQMIDDWVNQARQWTDGASIALTAGQTYLVEMEYYEKTHDAVAKLKWTGPSFVGTNGAIIGQQWLYDGTGVTNWPAIAYPQSVSLLQNTNLAITLLGSGNNLTYAISTSPAHGALSGTPPYVIYSPAANYSGSDSFTFYVNNGVSNSAPATVSIGIWAGLPVSYTWKSAASGYWSVAGNWTSGAPGAAGQPYYTLNFTPSGTYTVSNDLNSGFVLNQLNIAGTVTFAGPNTPAFTANGPVLPQINQNSANAVTFNVPLNLAAMTVLGGTAGGQVTIGSLISGAGGLNQSSTGTLQINNAANTYSGGTIINNGTVSIGLQDNAALGTGTVTINDPGTLILERVYASNALVLNGGTIIANNGFGDGFSGPVTLNGNATIQASYNMTVGGNITGPGGFTLTGNNTLILPGANSFTGPNYITAGTLKCSTSTALGTGPLSISDGAIVNLSYTGTRTIAALTLGGTNEPPGTYGSTSSSAANKDSHFTGSGTVTVSALLSIANSPATGVTASSAALDGTLGCAGTNAAVYAYWNTVNGGTSPTFWTNSVYIGSWTNAASTNLSFTRMGLAPGTTYFFTFRATNTAYNVWATNVQSFTTLALPGPGVDNASGATNLSIGVAQLRATLSNGPADVRFCWGTTDGGASQSAWTNVSLVSNSPTGAVAANVSNLLYGLTYYYRSYVSNQWGTAWAATTTNFTTLRPASSLANSAATGITTTLAALNATLACTGAVYDVVAYWNTTSGGTNAALWANSAYVGSWTDAASASLSYPATGLAPNTACFFTFRATNALDSLWAANVLSFTTLTPPGPVVDNNAGAANLSAGVAQLQGNLTNGPADVRLYWGTADGGMNLANWANVSLLAGMPSGSFSGDVSNLLYGLTYYYRAYASNQWGTAWAPATASFTTLKPLGVPAGQIPYASLVEVAASSESPGEEATNAFNGNGLLADGNTHGTYGEWVSSGAQPVSDQWLKVRFDQSYALDYLRVWAFNEGEALCVTNANVYVINSDIDPGNNVNLGGGPFNATGWNLLLAQQALTPSPGGSPETNTDPHTSLSGVTARQLALKINSVWQDLGLAGFAEVQIYRLAPTPINLTNSVATGVAATTAGLNGTLACAGATYDVMAYWNTVNGGTDPALWTNSAYVGTWTDVATTALSFTATGLAPNTPYFFTFRATNVVDSLWATNVQSFATLASLLPPIPVLPANGVTITGGVPSFSFTAAAGCMYRLDYKNALTDADWTLGDWSTNSTESPVPMTLTDSSAAGQPQRFYRLEAAKP